MPPTTSAMPNTRHQELLVVDLDGTLLRTDMLWEQLAWLARTRLPTAILLFLKLLAPGNRASVKWEIAIESAGMPVDVLPWRVELLEVLRERRANGATCVLATATNETIARRVGLEAGVFDAIIGSDATTNLKGARKLGAIEAKYPGRHFTYAGDSNADTPLFDAAKEVMLVNAPSRLRERYIAKTVLDLRDSQATASSALRLMRPHHWVKNALVFLPVLAGHRISDLTALSRGVGAALSFSLMASAIYCLNDLLDMDADRRHRSKSTRPLAAGDISAPSSVLLASVLFASSLALASVVNALWVIALYAFMNIAYSLELKRKPILDVMLLAAMYAMRVVAGGVATAIQLSSWLIAFSLFFFLALALAKRYTELLAVPEDGWAAGRGYAASDRVVVMGGGLAVSVAACLVLALYVSSPQVEALYNRPFLLWIAVPVAMYWLLRLWLIAGRGRLNDDPIVFALRDRVTYVAGVITLVAVILASR